ncbi:hypothetical protein E3N88_39731 [Mikania micrantha]|uniref:Uncharacterized protein n=1 Tax=Mikania micrantha TaxID=192012 RepID=A0A5N6LKP0_9ASTR|nr:hypothetical protein E3N88_39731 [Mikania micrantha]
MPHLRSHGPPPELSLPLRSDSRDFSKGSTSEVSASIPISADFSECTPSSSSSSSTHSSPRLPFVPPMANRRTVHQQSTEGFMRLNNPITVPNITNENSWQIPLYIMTAINNSQFNGRDDEDAPAHIARLTRICVTTRSGRGGERVDPPVEVVEEEPVDEEIEMETPGGVHMRPVPASTTPSSESPVVVPVEKK